MKLPNAVVLTLDDEPEITRAIRLVLEEGLGVKVVEANSPERALDVLRGTKVDLILSDQNMPGMLGLGFLAEAAKLAPGVPRALLTSSTEFEIAVRAVNENEIRAFFPKPIEPVAFLRSVTRILEERERAKLERQGFEQAALAFRKESTVSGTKDPKRPFVGALGPADDERSR